MYLINIMARSCVVLFIVLSFALLASNIQPCEARKLSMIMRSLVSEPISPIEKGHDMATNEKLSSLSFFNRTERVLMRSVPSPGIGN